MGWITVKGSFVTWETPNAFAHNLSTPSNRLTQVASRPPCYVPCYHNFNVNKALSCTSGYRTSLFYFTKFWMWSTATSQKVTHNLGSANSCCVALYAWYVHWLTDTKRLASTKLHMWMMQCDQQGWCHSSNSPILQQLQDISYVTSCTCRLSAQHNKGNREDLCQLVF